MKRLSVILVYDDDQESAGVARSERDVTTAHGILC